MYFIPQSQCFRGIGKEGTEELNTFARNIGNNATGKLIKRNVCRILIGFLKWRGPTEYPSTEPKNASLPACLQGTDQFQLSKEEQHENSHHGPDTYPPGPAVPL